MGKLSGKSLQGASGGMSIKQTSGTVTGDVTLINKSVYKKEIDDTRKIKTTYERDPSNTKIF